MKIRLVMVDGKVRDYDQVSGSSIRMWSDRLEFLHGTEDDLFEEVILASEISQVGVNYENPVLQ